jgi:hypothetical protein
MYVICMHETYILKCYNIIAAYSIELIAYYL